MKISNIFIRLAFCLFSLTSCGGGDGASQGGNSGSSGSGSQVGGGVTHTPLPDSGTDPNASATATTPLLLTPPLPFALPAAEQVAVKVTPVATFAAPWSMTFLPDGRLLVTERPPTPANDVPSVAAVRLVTQSGQVSAALTGLPAGTVGVLDVKIHPNYATNHLIYLTVYEEDATSPRIGRGAANQSLVPAGIAVVSAKLTLTSDGGGRLDDAHAIWRQFPKIVSTPGSGQPGGRMAFSPDGRYLFVTAGDRQEYEAIQSDPQGFTEAMEFDDTLGKVVRLYADGSVPADNPFASRTDARSEIWSLGHRNPYGLAFDLNGNLWENEMGPKGGDEINLIVAGRDYGWPLVSYGSNYGDEDDRNPVPGDGFATAAFWWTPTIAPSGMIFYSGNLFPALQGDGLLSGLQSHGLVRIRVTGTRAAEVQRIPLGARIRSVVQGPDGAIWVLEDGPNGRLERLDPA